MNFYRDRSHHLFAIKMSNFKITNTQLNEFLLPCYINDMRSLSLFILSFFRSTLLFIWSHWFSVERLPFILLYLIRSLMLKWWIKTWRHNAWLIAIDIGLAFDFIVKNCVDIAKRQAKLIRLQCSIKYIGRTLKCNGWNKIRTIYEHFYCHGKS